MVVVVCDNTTFGPIHSLTVGQLCSNFVFQLCLLFQRFYIFCRSLLHPPIALYFFTNFLLTQPSIRSCCCLHPIHTYISPCIPFMLYVDDDDTFLLLFIKPNKNRSILKIWRDRERREIDAFFFFQSPIFFLVKTLPSLLKYFLITYSPSFFLLQVFHIKRSTKCRIWLCRRFTTLSSSQSVVLPTKEQKSSSSSVVAVAYKEEKLLLRVYDNVKERKKDLNIKL